MSRRKSRRGEWAQMRDSMTNMVSQKRGVEGREVVPDIACGICKKFSENAYGSDGRGYCKVLKTGSDIKQDPPVYILEGEAALLTIFNMDASKCKYFEKMAFIDTDATECADPQYRRTQRQMAKKK